MEHLDSQIEKFQKLKDQYESGTLPGPEEVLFLLSFVDLLRSLCSDLSHANVLLVQVESVAHNQYAGITETLNNVMAGYKIQAPQSEVPRGPPIPESFLHGLKYDN